MAEDRTGTLLLALGVGALAYWYFTREAEAAVAITPEQAAAKRVPLSPGGQMATYVAGLATSLATKAGEKIIGGILKPEQISHPLPDRIITPEIKWPAGGTIAGEASEVATEQTMSEAIAEAGPPLAEPLTEMQGEITSEVAATASQPSVSIPTEPILEELMTPVVPISPEMAIIKSASTGAEGIITELVGAGVSKEEAALTALSAIAQSPEYGIAATLAGSPIATGVASELVAIGVPAAEAVDTALVAAAYSPEAFAAEAATAEAAAPAVAPTLASTLAPFIAGIPFAAVGYMALKTLFGGLTGELSKKTKEMWEQQINAWNSTFPQFDYDAVMNGFNEARILGDEQFARDISAKFAAFFGSPDDLLYGHKGYRDIKDILSQTQRGVWGHMGGPGAIASTSDFFGIPYNVPYDELTRRASWLTNDMPRLLAQERIIYWQPAEGMDQPVIARNIVYIPWLGITYPYESSPDRSRAIVLVSGEGADVGEYWPIKWETDIYGYFATDYEGMYHLFPELRPSGAGEA